MKSVRGKGEGAPSYDAFISYSHGEDAELVEVLQASMGRIGKPWYRRRALRVFRDVTGLSANPGLWSSITEAMDDSAWFVLIASPGAARSPWVDREVGYWLDHGDATRMLVVLTAGTWEWDVGAGEVDLVRSSAAPPNVRDAFGEEPRHIDLRWAQEEANLTVRSARLRDQVAEIAAPIHGVSKEELEGTDLREHRRTIRLARAAVAVLLALSLVAGIAAVTAARNAHRAEVNQARAERARKESDFQRLVAQARDLRRSQRDLSLLLAIEARRLRDTPESRGAIQAAILADPRYLGPSKIKGADEAFSQLCPTGTGATALAGTADGTWASVDLATEAVTSKGRLTASAPADSQTMGPRSEVHCFVSPTGGAAGFYTLGGQVWSVDPRSSTVGSGLDIGQPIDQAAVSLSGSEWAAGTLNGRLDVWSRDAPEARRSFSQGERGDGVAVAFSPSGATLATTTRTSILIRSTSDWRVVQEIPDPPADQAGGLVALAEAGRSLTFSPDGRFLLDARRAVLRMVDVRNGRIAWEQANSFIDAATGVFDHTGASVFIDGDTGSVERRRTEDGIVTGAPFQPTEIFSLSISPAGSTIYLTSSARPVVGRWALDGRTPISRTIGGGASRPVGRSPNGRYLAIGPPGTSMVTDGRLIDMVDLHTVGKFPTAAFPSPNDDGVLAGYFVDELAVDHLDVGSGQRIGPKFDVSLDGVTFAGVGDEEDVVIGYENGDLRRFRPDGTEVGSPWAHGLGSPTTIEISPRRDLVVVSYLEDTIVYRMKDGRRMREFPHRRLGWFNLDGHVIAMFKGDELELRNPYDGKLLRTVAGTSAANFADLQSKDYFSLYSSTSTQLYDWKTGRMVGDPFPGQGDSYLFPDSKHLAVGGPNGTVIWDIDPDDWERAACRLAGRDLTHKEWATYLRSRPYHQTCS